MEAWIFEAGTIQKVTCYNLGWFWLRLHRAAQHPSIHLAAHFGDIKAVKKILEADPQALDRRSEGEPLIGEGSTALHESVNGKNQEMVEFLLQRGADVSLANRYGQTPLDRAVEMRESQIVEILRRKNTN